MPWSTFHHPPFLNVLESNGVTKAFKIIRRIIQLWKIIVTRPGYILVNKAFKNSNLL